MTMRAPTIIASLFALGLSITGCDADLGDAGSDTDAGSADAGGSNGDSGSSPDGFEPCSNANPCPDGQFCFNGLCALGCTTDDNCADNQYCDTTSLLCQNVEVPTCEDADDCFGDQVCVGGLCSTPPVSTECMPAGSPDGCGSNAVCFAEDDEGAAACYTMPACAEDGSCPVGLSGATCNDGYFPDKDRICLVGACESQANCPSDWSCVQGAGLPLGICSSGLIGSVCLEDDHCSTGSCMITFGIGICL